ncbi:MAG TPA: PAS-domain containing protein, partial [Sphingomonas sp.]
ISGQAARIAERSIARVIGAPSARLIVTSTMAGGMLDVGDVVRLLDQNEQNLHFSRTLLAATLEAIDPGVSVVDSNLRLIAWNPRYQEMFEYPAGLVAVGRPVADLIRSNAERGDCGPGEVDAHVERRLAHLRRGLAHSFERRRPNGRWIKTVGHAMPGGGYVMSFTDITAEKERQRELEERVAERTRDLAGMNAQLHAAKTAAETATRTKTQFLAAASHDLLQPLHAARLFCAALEREARPEQLALVRHVDGAIRSADLLLRSLLDVSKLDAGGVIPRPEPVDLAALIGALVAECAPVAAERRIGLCAHPGRFHIRSDPALLRSVVQNLLSNALYYTPAGGRVWIGARRRRGRIAIEVRDSGVGIPEADLGRIFGEFVRLDTGHARGGGGVGLGLAIVQRIALLLDLRIEVRSRPGAGSTFAVHLPETAEDMPPGAGLAIAPPAAAASGAMPHILCLDDDEHILAALAAALASRGCFAHPCRTPAEALAVADEAEPAAALLDLHLGGAEDGLDVARRLRALWPALPIAIVTADPVAARDSRFAGLDVALLAKPVEPERLWRFLGAVPGPEVSPAA